MKTIRDILTGRRPVSLGPAASVADAVKAMVEERVGAVLVLDGDRAIGCFTERDLMTRVVVLGLAPAEVPLGSVMTQDLFTASPDLRINEVAREMQQRHIRHLPVVEDGRVVEMLSLRELIREHLDLKRHEVRALTAYIQGEGEAPPA